VFRFLHPFENLITIEMGECYAPEINKRLRPHLKLAGASYRLDEAYIKVGKQWKYLYRALAKEGSTIEFMREREA
jgi:transposase, IS6 family